MNDANSGWCDEFDRFLDLNNHPTVIAYSNPYNSDIIFFSQSHVLSFSECLNTIPAVLVVGSKRREDNNKEIP